ncbi:glycerate kinase [Bifidobacterium magnum]|uniref:glycerate kinase n=1 Tax=Bifidobacterium magnum TaxID=1692 RepID=UPI000400FD1C|nr:glycerate kinase [Bifidobacterium magnum]
MKIIVAPDSFKGSLSAREAADAIARGVRGVLPHATIHTLPMADGGEGTMQALVDATAGTLHYLDVTGPMGAPVRAAYGILGDGATAVIEMAQAAGLDRVRASERDPRLATTYGVGELMRDALEQGVRSFIVGLGGSATNDGGAGMAQALGARLLDAHGRDLPHGGASLANLATIDRSGLDKRLEQATVRIACDVTNPLTGPDGASHVFGPQKGADEAAVRELDAALHHYARVVAAQLGRDVEHEPGAAAAGGLGAGLLAFTPAVMESGSTLVTRASGLARLAQDADLCITGEGGIDGQTRFGKTPLGVARTVKAVAPNCTVVAVAANIGAGAEDLYELGIDAIFGMLPGVETLEQAMGEAKANLERTGANVARLFAHARR